MNSVMRVFKNTAAEVGAQGVNFIVTMIYSIFLVRLLGPERYGKYSLSFNFASFFGVFVAYGFGWLITDRVARDRSRAGVYLGNVIPLQIVLGTITIAAMTLIAFQLKYPADTTLAIVISGGGMLALQMYVTVNSIFRAFERLEINSLIIVSQRILSAFLGASIRGLPPYSASKP
jgi:PST family polysaccharide transporter